MLKLWSGLCRD